MKTWYSWLQRSSNIPNPLAVTPDNFCQKERIKIRLESTITILSQLWQASWDCKAAKAYKITNYAGPASTDSAPLFSILLQLYQPTEGQGCWSRKKIKKHFSLLLLASHIYSKVQKTCENKHTMKYCQSGFSTNKNNVNFWKNKFWQ